MMPSAAAGNGGFAGLPSTVHQMFPSGPAMHLTIVVPMPSVKNSTIGAVGLDGEIFTAPPPSTIHMFPSGPFVIVTRFAKRFGSNVPANSVIVGGAAGAALPKNWFVAVFANSENQIFPSGPAATSHGKTEMLLFGTGASVSVPAV